MNGVLASGLFMILLGTFHLVSALMRRGERFEYAQALFIAELGLMVLVGQMMPPDLFGLLVTGVFGISALVTYILWLKLFREYKGRTGG